MFWNNRVLKRFENDEGTHLYIVEVYYEDDDTVIGWTEGKDVYGESIEELKEGLQMMLECLNKPILIESELLAEIEATQENEIKEGEERLTMDEVLESLGLEREDVEEGWENEGGSHLPTWDGPDSA